MCCHYDRVRALQKLWGRAPSAVGPARPGPPVPRSPGAGGAKAPQVILKPDYT